MALLPQSNARLLTITRGGFTEDYDRPAGSIDPVWQGNVDAYVQQRILSNFNNNGGLDRVEDVTLFISSDISVMPQAGDYVTYEAGDPNSAQTFTGRVQNITDPAFLPTLPDYYKLPLEEVNAS